MPQTQIEIRETVLAECEYLVNLELKSRHPHDRPPRKEELRSLIKHFHTALKPLFETRWAFKPSIPAVDKSWRERAIARLSQADLKMFETRYSEDQPRDEHGRFGNSGGPAEKGVEKGETAKSRQEHKQAAQAHKEMATHHEEAANKADAKADKAGVKNHLAAAYAHEAAAKAHSEAAGAAVHLGVPHDKARSLSISANNATAKAYKR